MIVEEEGKEAFLALASLFFLSVYKSSRLSVSMYRQTGRTGSRDIDIRRTHRKPFGVCLDGISWTYTIDQTERTPQTRAKGKEKKR
jgi:hypothetical protein